MSRPARPRAETDKAIRNAKPESKPYKMAAGGGMYLLVNPGGSKLWRMKYRFQGKEKTLSFGPYPETKLADARAEQVKARKQIADGLDPMEVIKAERIAEAAEQLTFKHVAERWYQGHAELAQKPWAPATARKVRVYLEKDFYPAIGGKPIASITRPELIAISDRMEKRGAFDVAKKAREWLAAIFDDALDRDEIPYNPAHRMKAGHRAKGVTSAPNPNVGFQGLPELLQAVEASGASVLMKSYIKLLALIACRPGELRLAQWPEFDLDNAVWNIPAERMKMRRPHSVPLQRQAVEILRQVQAIRPDGHLFVLRGDKPMTDMAANMQLKRLGYNGKQTTHGFRHLLSTELHERGYNSDWIEAQLAHKVEGIRGVYNSADHMESRRGMMQDWADSIDAVLAGANVIAFKRA